MIDSERLTVDPLPDEEAVSPSAIDLTLADSMRLPYVPGGDAAEITIDARNSGAVMDAIQRLSTEASKNDDGSYSLKPGQFMLAWTRERISLPNFLAARVEGRSTLARLGLSVHQSAPIVHATFSGQLQLELTNAGPFLIKLYPGQRICQLVLETMSLPAVTSLQSVHQGQSGG